MRRRALLAALPAATAGVAGCPLFARCSRPPSNADRLEFDSRTADSSEWANRNEAVLVTEPAHVERLLPPEDSPIDYELPESDRTYIEDTDFGSAFLVAVVVGSSGNSSEPRITHAVRDDDRIHLYACIRRRGMTDDWAPYPRLVRLFREWTPSGIRVTFTDGRDGVTSFDRDGTGPEWPEG